MNNKDEIKTIDPRGLEHHEKEKLIFPSIEDLSKGDSLRIVMEFNPVPLVYLLKTRGEFEVFYEKDGPDEWILVVKRIAAEEMKKEKLEALVQKLKSGNISEETKARTKELFQAADAKSIGEMEQKLIKQGIPRETILGNLCDIHLEILRDKLVDQKVEVESPHPVHSFMEEHKVILESLSALKTTLDKLRKAKSFKKFGPGLEKLRDSAHHLVEAESHHQREEESLFTKLEDHDITEPVAVMKSDHVEFRERKQALYQLAYNPKDYDFESFKTRCVELGEYLVEELESHIFKEDNIIYQVALQTLSEKEWEVVKRECDKIGYCCFTPQDQIEKSD
ncbi:MAG: DUF438 domain-containing protein [Desulfobacterales bacterium]|jgi:hypothetical protein|nr:hypothetical protein [Desulfobacter sp.]MDP6394871.1 DUF438 domain-containing protein [Desulfobacterales bacterium]MDP6682042.1 DUF438 domain-containing protein [Desulfobacterales bacterium]MDP6807710.1 DUF438 domain-containing protein [Desulfobacterales bacterium]|tara:strand:+ start:23796 stop:24803 length:1008 start_codon:yes stop_codon:yes gene_type:complete